MKSCFSFFPPLIFQGTGSGCAPWQTACLWRRVRFPREQARMRIQKSAAACECQARNMLKVAHIPHFICVRYRVPVASMLICGSIATLSHSARSLSWISVPGVAQTSFSPLSTTNPAISRVRGYGQFANPILAPLANTRSTLWLRGGRKEREDERMGLKRQLQNDGSDSTPQSTSRKKRAKVQLIDVDETGIEISRRNKGPGRAPSEYAKREDGNWYKVSGAERVTKPATKAQTEESEAPREHSEATLEPTDELAAIEAKPVQAWRDSATNTYSDSFRRKDSLDELTMPEVSRPFAAWTQHDLATISIDASLRGNLAPRSNRCWDPPPSEWVVFSDLHVSRASLPTCLEVLDRVHEEAVRRGAGVIFLGDFWHEKGILRIEPLNAVLHALSNWTVPLVALPGNHDQATLDGTAHGLVPLAMVLPSAHIISVPTVMLNALWIPYRRDQDAVKHAMATMVTDEVRAIFCHVDILGADMGQGFLAERGLSLDDFPPHLPVFTGHYHKSHDVARSLNRPRPHPVRYIGSQYQTSMREAEEDKVMLVLRTPEQLSEHAAAFEPEGPSLRGLEETAEGGKTGGGEAVWKVQEEIPVEFGVRHFRAKSLQDLERFKHSWALRKGDRVQVCVDDAAKARPALRALEKELRVRLEVREEAEESRMARVPKADTLDAPSLLRMYFDHNATAIDPRVRSEAESLLRAVQEEVPAEENKPKRVTFDTVEIQGFGSFGHAGSIRYPLSERGVVLVMGKNEDEESSDSNGSGKTTLCMAALWALTGSADVRADGKRLGRRDVVHTTAAAEGGGEMGDSVLLSDDGDETSYGASAGSKGGRRRPKKASATVALHGTVNDLPFEVKRRVSLGRQEAQALTLTFNGEDLTRSTVKDTQSEIARVLPVSVLSDAVFHGQHLVTGLLEKTDKDFKVALDNLIPTEVWTRALDRARENKKTARARRDELAGRIKEKESEEEPMRDELAKARAEAERWDAQREEELKGMQEELSRREREVEEQAMAVGQCRSARDHCNEELSARQAELEQCLDSMAAERQGVDAKRTAAETALREAREREGEARAASALVRSKVRELQRAEGRASAARERRGELEAQESEWKQGQRAGAERGLREANEAMVAVEGAREALKAYEAAKAKKAEELAAAVNASELLFEAATQRAVAAEARAEAAKKREAQYSELQHDPTCRLCLQPIKEDEHAKHLHAMTAEVEREEAEQQAADQNLTRATEERANRRAALACAEEEGAAEARRLREKVSEHEEAWRRARLQVASLEGDGQSPQHVALEGVKAEEARCAADKAELEREITRTCTELYGELGAAGEVFDGGRMVLRMEEREGERAGKVAEAEAERDTAEREVEETEKQWGTRLGSLREASAAAKVKADEAAERLETATRKETERTQLADKLSREREKQNPWIADLKRWEAAAVAAKERVGQLEQQRTAAEDEGRVWAKLEELFGKRGLQSFVYEVAVLDLQRRAAGYLELLSDDSLRLQLSLGEQVVDRTLLVRSAGGGYAERSMQQLSGGQWRRLSLALSLAFSEASLERTHTTCNLIVLDEIMQHLDSEGCVRVARLLEGLVEGEGAKFRTALVILQTAVGEELGDSFDEIDVVVKKGDASFVRSATGKVY